jgi:hypothetical protein
VDNTLILSAIILSITNIVFAALAWREHIRAEAAQRHITRLVAQSRPRPPHHYAAGYDTGLQETPYGRDN